VGINWRLRVKNIRKLMLSTIAIVVAAGMMSGSSLYAQDVTHTQDISGDWQGTLRGSVAGDLRLIVHITKSDNGGWSGLFYIIDQSPDGIPIGSVTLEGSDFKFSIAPRNISYGGKLSADGASIKGTWTGLRVLPLDFQRATKETLWHRDTSPHAISFITVDGDVKLEVLDWGGSGRPLVFLAGLGNDAHIFDKFAPKFTTAYHVYGITRRGFGASSAPAPTKGNYSADRLGDDVLAVLDSLKLDRPVLAGHSIAGEELSSVGSRHPEKVAGLIYLDAGYSYAFYDSARGDLALDMFELRKTLDRLLPGSPDEQKQLISGLLQTALPQFERDLQRRMEQLRVTPARPRPQPPQRSAGAPVISSPGSAIAEGQQKYSDIPVPILAIFAVPHNWGQFFREDPAGRAAMEAWDAADTGAQAKAFESGLHSAHVVRLPNADHYIFNSNEVDVLREMNAFLAKLQ
jgi:non-heme chloroperoxidase